MEFVGLETFCELDVEVRTPDGVYDLHNSAVLRSVCINPGEFKVEVSWTMTDHGLRTGPGRSVTLLFEGCRSVTADGDLFDSSDTEEPMELDGISYMPGSNGPDWLQLIFENDARLTLLCDRCVVKVQLS